MTKKIHYIFVLLLMLAITDSLAAAIRLPKQGVPVPIETIGGTNGATNDENKLYVSTQLTVSNLYPNPADNYVELDYNLQDNTSDVKLTIRNVLGVLIGEYGLVIHGSKLHIDTSRLSAGVYFYTLSIHNKNVATKKLLIRN